MNSKLHFQSQHLRVGKFLKKSQFYSEEENASTPDSLTSIKKSGFQTDDSDAGTPLSPKQSPTRTHYSKFKPKEKTSYLAQKGKHLIQSHHIHSDADLQKSKETNEKLNDHPFRYLIFGRHISEETFIKHLTLTQRGLIYATKCLKGPSDEFIKTKTVEFPIEEHKPKILLLDLDETLIHACQGKEIPQVRVNTIGFNIRPYVNYFLTTLSQIYSIYIFTASSAHYASTIVDYLDPQQNKIIGIFCRDHCMETKNGFFIKDLRILKDVDLRKTILVDNLSHSFGLQIDNGVPILEWLGDQKDQELKYLTDYLVKANEAEDVREYNKQQLKLRDLLNFEI